MAETTTAGRAPGCGALGREPGRSARSALRWLAPLVLSCAALLLALAAAAPPAHAAEAELVSADPALEKQVLRIAAELRCLVCQNQTIADSHADLAIDLRNQVREMLKKGNSEAEILAFMTARYGDFVLYRPPVKNTTWLLWFGPALFMLTGLAILVTVLRRRARLAPDQFEPDDEELLGENAGGPASPAAAGATAATSAAAPAAAPAATPSSTGPAATAR